MRPMTTPLSNAHRTTLVRVLVVLSAALAASALLASPASANPVYTIYTGNAADDRIDVINGDDGTPIGSFGTGLGGPSGVKLGPDGNVYAARTGSNSIGVFMPDGTPVQTILPGGPFLGASDLDFAPDGSFLVVYSISNHVVRYVLPGIVVGVWSTGTGTSPHRITVAPSGSQVYVSLKGTDRVGVYSIVGAFLQFIGTPGSGPGQLLDPAGVAFNPNDGTLYIVESGNNRVQRFTPTGSPLNQWPSSGSPSGIEFTGGRIWVANSLNNHVSSFDPNGTALGTVPANAPTDIAVKFAPATPPAFTSTPPTTGTVGMEYSYDPVVSGTQPMTFTLVSGPTGMTADPDDGQIRWTPNVPGNFPVLLGVENAAGTATQSWTIDVNPSAANGSIGANVFTDFDGDGVKELADTGLMDALLYLDQNRNGVLDDDELRGPTDTAGRFTFTGLAAGTYYVKVASFPNLDYVQTTPDPGAVEITPTNPTGTVSFGAFGLGRASGTVFADLNGNGVRDPGDPGLSGWTVFVDQDTNGLPGPGEPQTVTDADGNYQLTGLGAGVAELVVQPQTGWQATGPTVIPLSATSGFNLIQHFGFELLPAGIEGTKYDDLDGDQLRDPGEPGLPGWQLYVDENGNDRLDSGEPNATSGSDGSFAISDLLSGPNSLKEVAQPGWQPLAARSVTLGPGATATVDLPNFKLGVIRGAVFNDLNGNGVRDPGEPGLPGRTVFVDLDTDGIPDPDEKQTTTDADGNYEITGLTAGPAELVAQIQEGDQPTGTTVIPVDVTSGFTLTRSFGFTVPAADLTATKSNDAGASAIVGTSFTWKIKVENVGDAPAAFADRALILYDDLPSSEGTLDPPPFEYGTPTVVEAVGVAGEIECLLVDISGVFDVRCLAKGKVTISEGGWIVVQFSATPLEAGTFRNPPDNGHSECAADPDDEVAEIDEENNKCSDTVTAAVVTADLTALKENDAGGSVALGGGWTWSIKVSNVGDAPATFSFMQDILVDDLPSEIADYGTPTITASTGVTGVIECSLVPAFLDFPPMLRCRANSPEVTIDFDGGFTVEFTARPSEVGRFTNPPDDGHSVCEVDPDDVVDEGEEGEGNNECNPDAVEVRAPDLSPFKSNDVAGLAILGESWTWSIRVDNIGDAPAVFEDGAPLLRDNLPSRDISYAITRVTGPADLECGIVVSTLICAASGGVVTLGPGSSIFVDLLATPSAVGVYENPTGGVCKADPEGAIREDEENNNDCQNTVVVVAPELTATKSNDVGGVATGGSFRWTITLANTSTSVDAAFDDTEVILRDNLPAGANYGSPTVTDLNSVTGIGRIACQIVALELTCTATGGNVIIGPTIGSLDVVIPVVPTTVGTLENPSNGTCQVDPDNKLAEGNELNNDCSDTVRVEAAGQPIIELGPDATDPTKTELRITGTPANDLIDVRGRNAAVDVTINSVPFGRFSPTGRIVITGLDGNDSIFVGGIVFSRRAWVDGGAGDDTITTGNGPSLLLGGGGNDRLQSGSARDLLIGGTGADQLFGQNGDDILISGTTTFDANTPALNAILAEWTSTRTYTQRINNLTGATSGGINGSTLLQPGTTVSGDTSADTLTGGRATDWFFASPNDTTDARAFETITQL